MVAPWSMIRSALCPLGRERRQTRLGRRCVPELGALEERAFLSAGVVAGTAAAAVPAGHVSSTTVKFPGGFVNTHHGTHVRFPGGFVFTVPGTGTAVHFPGGSVNSTPGNNVIHFPGGSVVTNHGSTVVTFPGGSVVVG